MPQPQRYHRCSYRLLLLERQPRQKHSHSGSSMLPPNRRVLKANGLKTVSEVGMRTTMLKVELRFVRVQDYIGGSKLQTAFAAGQGPDIFIISSGDFRRTQWRRFGRPHFLHG